MEKIPTRKMLENYTFHAALDFIARNSYAINSMSKDDLIETLHRLYRNREAEPTIRDCRNILNAIESAIVSFEHAAEEEQLRKTGPSLADDQDPYIDSEAH